MPPFTGPPHLSAGPRSGPQTSPLAGRKRGEFRTTGRTERGPDAVVLFPAQFPALVHGAKILELVLGGKVCGAGGPAQADEPKNDPGADEDGPTQAHQGPGQV